MSGNQENLKEPITESPKKVNVVILHEEKILADTLASIVNTNKRVAAIYYTGEEFLKNFEQYPKDTTFFFSYYFTGDLTVKDIATKLHDAGYTDINLYTGASPAYLEKCGIPSYVKVFSSENTKKVVRFLGDHEWYYQHGILKD